MDFRELSQWGSKGSEWTWRESPRPNTEGSFIPCLLTTKISQNVQTPSSWQGWLLLYVGANRLAKLCISPDSISRANSVRNNTVLCLVTQSCPALCDLADCSPPGSSVHEDSPGKDARVGGHALLQGIFPTQGSNPGLLPCGQILYQLSTREAQECWSG